MDTFILETRQLSKSYGHGEAAVHALRSLDVNIVYGQFTVIMGRSGSGKSTLLHLLGALDKPTAGKVFLQRVDLFALPDDALTRMRRRKIGFVFQFYNLVQELTAYENMLLPLMLDGQPLDSAHVDQVVGLLGLENRLKHRPGALSGGQQQRVAIARALIAKPAIVLADEPTGNLDGKSASEVMDLLRLSARTFGQTMVMVTHDARLAEHADRIIELDNGLVISDSGAGR
ncbi:MAG: ABC transporter ATP-binding protein [Bacillota bacterium]|nr:ABC transporter ATP-binding protein [Bacillota bacterium]